MRKGSVIVSFKVGGTAPVTSVFSGTVKLNAVGVSTKKLRPNELKSKLKEEINPSQRPS